jgi:hypothetical protein
VRGCSRWNSTGGPPKTSNCYCLPGRAGGSPDDVRSTSSRKVVFKLGLKIVFSQLGYFLRLLRRRRGGYGKCSRRLHEFVIEEGLVLRIVHELNNDRSRSHQAGGVGPAVATFKRGPNTHRTSLAILVPTTIPTSDKVASIHKVRRKDQVCGDFKDNGTIRRFIHSIPRPNIFQSSNYGRAILSTEAG